MSTTKSSGSGAKGPSDSSSGANKKGKSKGFIESSDFKPGWLETGPLPPLPPPPISDTPDDSQSVAEELAALQEALQRYYGTSSTDEAQPTEPASAPATDGATLESDTSEPMAEVVIASERHEPIVHEPVAFQPASEDIPIDTPPAAPPADDAPATTPPDPLAPPAWILAIAPATDTPQPAAPPTDDAPAIAPPDPSLATPAWVLGIAPPTEGAPSAALPVPETAVAATPAFETEPDVPDDVTPPAPPLPLPEIPAPETIFYFTEPPTEQEAAPVAIGDVPPPSLDEPVAQPARRSRRERRTERPIRRRSRLSTALLALSLLLLAAAAVIYFVNPFTRLALGLASLARPVASPSVAPPNAADGDWCLQGSFPSGDAQPQLQDDGAQGDLVANDRVYSLEYAIPRPGNYLWQIVGCDDPTRTFPAAMAWLTTSEPNQAVTFVFDSNERADRLFFPIPYVVSAVDGVEEYHVVGSFQEWIADDASGRLEPISSGLYQQVRRIARSGSYEAYVIAGNEEQAIDAYGRTTEPIPFAFDTEQNGEYVVFLVDVDRGRASVMYDMPPLVTRLAFGGGNRLLSLALVGLAGLLVLFLLLREMTLRNERLWMETGCPRCREQELMRISRRTTDRLLHLLGIPAYRYRCRNCTWEGTRLSEAGRSISPGASITRIEGLR